MKARVHRQEFAEALGIASGVAPLRTPKPILQCVLLEAQADACVLKATDLELSVRCTVAQVEVEQQGRALVSAEKLSQIVRESNDEVLAIELAAGICHIRGQDSHFQIYSQEAGEFPPVPDTGGAIDFEVEAAELRRLAEWTVFAAAKENSRYAINGVLWETEGDKLSLVSTDGRRLSRAVAKMKAKPKKGVRVIVPTKTMQLFLRILSDNEPVGVQASANLVVLHSPRATVSSALVEGQFPKYQDVVPTDSDKQAELKTAEFLSAIRRAALLANEESRSIRLAFAKDELTLTSRAPEQGEALVRLLASYDGPAFEIGFNPVYLMDILKVVSTDRITFEMKESNRPGVIRMGPDFLYVVMPLNLS